MSNREAVIAEIRRCRAEGQTRPSFGADTLTVAEAYQVQLALAQERERAGDPIVGYKLGLISPAKQRQMNVAEPIVGHLHRSMLIDPGEPVPRNRFIQPRVEPELGLVFDRDVTGSSPSAQELAEAVAYAILAVDVLDSIYGGYQFGAADVVADNASGGAAVIGSRPLPVDVLWNGSGLLRLALDGGPWASGTVADLGDTAGLLEWAARHIASMGRGIRAGDVLLLGAPCAAVLLGDAAMLTAEGPLGSRLVAAVV